MTWAEISWILVAALIVTLLTATVIAVFQVLGSPRLGLSGSLLWVVAIVVIPPVAVPVWLAYGRPWSNAFAAPRRERKVKG